MKKLVMSVLLLLPAAALAGSAFDGTWKTRTNSMKTTGKPDVIAVADGMYVCSSCVPEIKVKADGTDHAVTGHSYYDTVAVAVLSPTSFEVTNKKGGQADLDRDLHGLHRRQHLDRQVPETTPARSLRPDRSAKRAARRARRVRTRLPVPGSPGR